MARRAAARPLPAGDRPDRATSSTSSRSTAASITGCARSSRRRPGSCPRDRPPTRRSTRTFDAMAAGPDEDHRAVGRRAHDRLAPSRRQRGVVRLRRAVRRSAVAARLPRDRAPLRRRVVSDIPALGPATADQARRFTWLVDVLYDHDVKLVASAAVEPDGAVPRGSRRARVPAHREPPRSRCARATTWRAPHASGETSARRRARRDRLTPRPSPRPSTQETPVQMQTFKAYRTFEDQGIVASRFVDMKVDELDPGDVLVRTKYSTINYKDALSYNGTGRIMRKFPTIAGIDMSGTVEASSDSRWKQGRQGDRARLRHGRGARRRLQRVRARAGRLGRAPARQHDRVRRDDARHRRLHGGARDPPDAAQRPRAGQRAGGGDRRDRWRRLRRRRDPRQARLRRRRDHRQGARGRRLAALDRREGSAVAPGDRPHPDPSARAGDLRRRGRQPRRRHPGVAAVDAEDRGHGQPPWASPPT